MKLLFKDLESFFKLGSTIQPMVFRNIHSTVKIDLKCRKKIALSLKTPVRSRCSGISPEFQRCFNGKPPQHTATPYTGEILVSCSPRWKPSMKVYLPKLAAAPVALQFCPVDGENNDGSVRPYVRSLRSTPLSQHRVYVLLESEFVFVPIESWCAPRVSFCLCLIVPR